MNCDFLTPTIVVDSQFHAAIPPMTYFTFFTAFSFGFDALREGKSNSSHVLPETMSTSCISPRNQHASHNTS